MAVTWHYERLDENGKIKNAPVNDPDGKITGRCVFGLKAWLDENPAERIRMGWIKHIHKDIREIEYNHQTQYLQHSTRRIDEYTIEDVYYVANKSEEMMRLEELSNYIWYAEDAITFIGGDFV